MPLDGVEAHGQQQTGTEMFLGGQVGFDIDTPLKISMVGTARFELTTSCSQSRRSTKLSYVP